MYGGSLSRLHCTNLSEVVGLIFDDWFAFPLGRVWPFGNRLKKLSGLGRDCWIQHVFYHLPLRESNFPLKKTIARITTRISFSVLTLLTIYSIFLIKFFPTHVFLTETKILKPCCIYFKKSWHEFDVKTFKI